MVTAWWETFFDRAYTEAWEAAGAFARTAEEVAGLLDLVTADAPLRILDVPCGFGRHAGLLHTAGHRVTGMDLSGDQLAIAADRHPGATYLRGDMRRPPAGPFDLVVNLFSSFGYFMDAAEDLVALRAWYDVLVPGGELVMTTNHRDLIARHGTLGERDAGGGMRERVEVDWVAGTVATTVWLPDGEERVFRMRLYSATELVALVEAAGFSDVRALGGFDGGPLTPDERLVIHARRE